MTQTSDYSILDSLLEGCQIIGFDYRYLYVNDTVAEHGRRSKGELLGHKMMEVYPGIENTPMFSQLESCMEERKPAELENEFTYLDGSTAWFALKMEPVPEGVFILSVDISDRKRVEIELQNQLRRIEALRVIDLAILSTTDLPLALTTILEQMTMGLDVDAADILLLHPHYPILEFAAGRGFRTSGIEKIRLRLDQGHASRAAMARKTIITPDLSNAQEPFLRVSLIEAEHFVAYCAAPLMAKGNLVGVLEVFHRERLQADRQWIQFLEALAQQTAIAVDNAVMFKDLQRSNTELSLAYDATLEGWSLALEMRDDETEGHTRRVTETTTRLAREMGIPEREIVHLRRGALLHDIGKIAISDSILLKPGPLDEDQWEIMRQHPVYAYNMLKSIDFLRPALDIPHCHHEKWEGSGYPQGLKGEQIPLAARIFAIVDVWDALSSDRPYRKAWSAGEVRNYLREQAGSHFDPRVAQVFLNMLEAGNIRG